MTKRKHVVIVGAGFGGLAAAKELAGGAVDVTLIDRTNHHLFQPLLYQVATAALSPSDIAAATRTLFEPDDHVQVLMDEVHGIADNRCEIVTAQTGAIPFDFLILATGVDYSYFGNDSWARHSNVLKTMEDALTIRERLLAAFEQAEREPDSAERRRLLTFVVIGAGPTGVEMAGAIAELGRTSMAGDYQRIRLDEIRIILVEAGSRVLPAFSERQSRQAVNALVELGVEVRVSAPVSHIDEWGVQIGGDHIPCANVIWSAGTRARDSGSWLGATTARNGAIVVNPDCSVPGHTNIFAIGDGASYKDKKGDLLPGLAPVAKQQGHYVGKLIKARVGNRDEPGPFQYRNWGTMAVIGRSRAIADFGRVKLAGHFAWLTWSLVHLLLLIDFRSRSSVYLSWAYAWFTRNRVARLLTRSSLPDFRIPSENEVTQ